MSPVEQLVRTLATHAEVFDRVRDNEFGRREEIPEVVSTATLALAEARRPHESKHAGQCRD